MTRFLMILIATLLVLAPSVLPDDLYHVVTETSEATSRLAATGLDPVTRLSDGYLVAVRDGQKTVLAASGLAYRLVAVNVEVESLAIDFRQDDLNATRFPVVFEQAGLRLFSVDFSDASFRADTAGLVPASRLKPAIVFREPVKLDMGQIRADLDLDSIALQVSQDSLLSYATHLESFYRRVSGTSPNIASRYWLEDKFRDFGYDSILIDSFEADIYDNLRTCTNLIVVKPGTEIPEKQIIVGAHRDAVPDCPGAEDNGSGSCAVLEIARLLKDIDNRMTIIFALFDAEEQGALGSYHYAGEAANRGDDIVFMLNMDMIAYQGNTDTARCVCGLDSSFALLWQSLADSLPSIDLTTNLIFGWGGSDHYPFYLQGYATVFMSAWNMSPHYHQIDDSVRYLDFEYHARMTRGSLVTVVLTDATYAFLPSLSFKFPDGIPDLIFPDLEHTVRVLISEKAGEQLVPQSCSLHCAVDGGDFTAAPMEDVGDGIFAADIPSLDCGSTVRILVSAEGISCGIDTFPASGEPFSTMIATANTLVMEDDFSSDLGWNVSGDATRGYWERVYAYGWTYQGTPPCDYDRSTWLYVTDESLGFNVDGGSVVLTSPSLNTSYGIVRLSYARWYNNHLCGAPDSDVFKVYVSNDDGANWVVIDSVGPVVPDPLEWTFREVAVGDFVQPSVSTRVKFVASDFGEDSNIEAGVDAFTLRTFTCDPIIATETLPEWTAGVTYSQPVVAVGGEGPFAFSDMYADLDGTGLVLSTEGLLDGVPATIGPVEFTALAIDAAGDSAIKPLSIQINAPVMIAPELLPGGTEGQVYQYPLTATGGTGDLTWEDINSDLEGTGLSLSIEGELTGTPIDTGVVTFTVRAEDEVGSVDEMALSVTVGLFYICGDINGDLGAIVDIADMVYLVDYMFTGGPDPVPMEAADVNGSSGIIDIADLVYLADYMFSNGPDLECP